MPRSPWPSFRALAGLLVVACSVYDVPTLRSESPTGGAGAGGSAGAGAPSGGSSPIGGGGTGAAAGTANPEGGVLTTGGSGHPVSDGGAADRGMVGGAGGDATSSGGAAGAPDVVLDECPDDPAKTAPGVCGCGLPDVSTALLASCKALTSKLLHRYDFEGSGTAVMDRVGASHGVLVGGATLSKLNGRGVVQLGGGASGPYVDLPNGLISSLSNATLEAWITWGGGNNYQRVFDFGDSDNTPPEDNPKNGKTYLFVSPKIGAGVAALGYSLMGNLSSAEQNVLGSAALPQALSQVVAVADATGDTLTLYVNGAQVGTGAWTGALSSINDVNAWLGRSQYNSDPELTATYHEFRIYGAALNAQEIATAFQAGTDPDFMPK